MRIALFLLLTLATGSARADTTLCTFSSDRLDVEFAGDLRVDAVYVQTIAGPRTLPATAYRVARFDARAVRVDFAFDNPGDATLPPSFTLEGTATTASIVIDGERTVGTLHCGP